jgi:hypothetical protein
MDAAVLLSAAANSGKFNDFKRGSGGRIFIPSTSVRLSLAP